MTHLRTLSLFAVAASALPAAAVAQSPTLPEPLRSSAIDTAHGLSVVGGRLRIAVDEQESDGILAFHNGRLAPPFDGEVLIQRIDDIGSGGTIANASGGCSTARAGVRGAPVIGNRDFGFTLTNAGSASLALLSVNLQRAHGVSCGGCEFMPGLIGLTARGPVFAVSIPIPCDTGLVNNGFDVQWAIVGVSGRTPCSLLPGIVCTDRLRIGIGY